MGLHKKYLPDLHELEKLKSNFTSDEEFLKKVIGKSDAIIGPSDSMRFIENIAEAVKQRKKDGNP